MKLLCPALICVASVIGLAVGCSTVKGSKSPIEATRDFYPIGIYAVNSTSDLPLVAQAGFNLVTGPAQREFLDAARQAGLRVLASPNTSAGRHFDAAALIHAVKELDAHPALWAWYLSDEPDLNGIPPAEVNRIAKALKSSGAKKPGALVLYRGYEALDYGNLTDITMIDHYPVPWLPLASFGQHVEMTRLALGKNRPLIAVIQAFDWGSIPEMLPGEKNLRAPTYAEMRCMTYEALARGANGLFYFAYDAGWKMREHPETWLRLQAVVAEVKARLPLFEARPQWWWKDHAFGNPPDRFNAALESAITSRLLQVVNGNGLVPNGDYILAVNNTTNRINYSFALPQKSAIESDRSIPVLDENRSIQPQGNRLADWFGAYAVHVYGPLN